MTTDYAGIDYGLGKSNIDIETGVRYGVINQRHVLQAWADNSEPYYGDEPENEEDDDGYDCAEPISHFYSKDGFAAECSSDDGDIFVTKSPFYTHAQFCSPCAPGAGYLTNPCKTGPKCYCFGHDWFEDGKAPYSVFRVDDGTFVYPNR